VLVLLAALVFLDRFVYRLLVHFKGRFAYIDITRGIVRGMLRLLIVAVGLLLLLEALHISISRSWHRSASAHWPWRWRSRVRFPISLPVSSSWPTAPCGSATT